MWAEQQSNGKVKFIERYVNPMTGKTGKVSVTMEKDNRSTRKAAEKVLEQKIEQKLKELTSSTAPESVTLQDLVDAYRAEQKRTVKASTYRRNFFYGNAMLETLGPDTLIDRLTAKYIRDRMYARDAKNSTINELLKRTKGILRWGYKNDYIADIAFLNKVSPLPDISYREKIEDKYLETEEFKRLISAMEVTKWKLLTEFLGLSGIRIGEALSLDKRDVDFNDRCIHVTTTYDTNNLIDTAPKSPSSYRDVYMQDDLYDVCKQISTYMLRQSLVNGYGKSPVFFQGEDGGRANYAAYNKYIKENGRRILGREKITAHILRHTHTCMLAENGVQLETITRRLGHEDSKITKQIYLHITKKMRQNDNDQIASVKIM